jgi:hypothetical protein
LARLLILHLATSGDPGTLAARRNGNQDMSMQLFSFNADRVEDRPT